MFWKGGFPGISLETQPTDDPVELDKEATKEEMEQYYEGLKRYIALEGMTAKNLLPQVADPGPHGELQIRLICISLSCPWRVFMGAEVGQLASGQDMVAWSRRMSKRQEEYLTPSVVRPFVDRMIVCGILPAPPKYTVWWHEVNAPSEDEKASIATKRTDAMSKYVAGGLDQLISPKKFLELVMKFEKPEVDSIVEEVEAEGKLIDTDPDAEREAALEDGELAHDRQMEVIKTEAKLKPKPAPRPAAK